ncbi:putative aluminum-activated malate transporter [Helianthus annuus]|nr:putative aluminum-activated malate transporter [Helianthus annuus]
MLIFPVWAGLELHLLIPRNMDKLAKSLDCCVADYFGRGDEESKKNLQGYKCVLNSKTSEEAMANFARWEPAHGRFNFRHPWKNYLKIGMSSRNCAYCIETLTSCLASKNKVPESIKKHLEAACMNLSTSSSNVIRELATVVSSMTRSAKINMAESAKFKQPEDEVKPKHNQTSNKINASDDENITVLQRV